MASPENVMRLGEGIAESSSSFGIVSALLFGFGVSVIFDTATDGTATTRVFIILLTISISASLVSLITFSILYSQFKMLIGRNKMDALKLYIKETNPYRLIAFFCVFVAALTFMLSAVMHVFRTQETNDAIICASIMLITVVGVSFMAQQLFCKYLTLSGSKGCCHAVSMKHIDEDLAPNLHVSKDTRLESQPAD
eukprot:143315_1